MTGMCLRIDGLPQSITLFPLLCAVNILWDKIDLTTLNSINNERKFDEYKKTYPPRTMRIKWINRKSLCQLEITQSGWLVYINSVPFHN